MGRSMPQNPQTLGDHQHQHSSYLERSVGAGHQNDAHQEESKSQDDRQQLHNPKPAGAICHAFRAYFAVVVVVPPDQCCPSGLLQ